MCNSGYILPYKCTERLILMGILAIFITVAIGVKNNPANAYDDPAPIPREPQKVKQVSSGPKIWITDFDKDGCKERIRYVNNVILFEQFCNKTDGKWKIIKALDNQYSGTPQIVIDDFDGDNLNDLLLVTGADDCTTYMNREILAMFPLDEIELNARTAKVQNESN